MNKNIITLKHWILSISPWTVDFDDTFDIIENGILDSIQFLELVYQIESLSGRELDMTEISLDDLSTLKKIEAKFF